MVLAMIPEFSPTASADGLTVSGGTGIEGDPYQIANPDDLKAFRKYISTDEDGGSGEYFKLTANIDLGDSAWPPISDFAGTFDGGGFTISGFYINDGLLDAGLFGQS